MTDLAQSALKTELVFSTPSEAHISQGGVDPLQNCGLLEKVIATHSGSELEGGTLDLVSLSLDQTGKPEAGVQIDFVSMIDRKTRTLIFANGLASQQGRPILKASVVYRIL